MCNLEAYSSLADLAMESVVLPVAVAMARYEHQLWLDVAAQVRKYILTCVNRCIYARIHNMMQERTLHP